MGQFFVGRRSGEAAAEFVKFLGGEFPEGHGGLQVAVTAGVAVEDVAVYFAGGDVGFD